MTTYMQKIKFCLLILILGFVTVSCNSKQSEIHKTNESNHYIPLNNDELTLVKPDSISLTYRINKTIDDSTSGEFMRLDAKSIRVTCNIKNNSKSYVYVLGYSCNDVPGYLKIDPSTFDEWQYVYCNMSWPEIHKIAPKASFEFSTNLRSEKSNKINSLGLSVKFVNRYIDFETLKEKPELVKNVESVSYDDASFLLAENN